MDVAKTTSILCGSNTNIWLNFAHTVNFSIFSKCKAHKPWSRKRMAEQAPIPTYSRRVSYLTNNNGIAVPWMTLLITVILEFQIRQPTATIIRAWWNHSLTCISMHLVSNINATPTSRAYSGRYYPIFSTKNTTTVPPDGELPHKWQCGLIQFPSSKDMVT